MEKDKFIQECPVLFKKFTVKKKIGHGAFGAVYLGKSIEGGQPVAIKIEKRNIDKPLLEGEAYLLASIKGIGIPSLISFGKTKSYRALVEPLLGDSLFDIFIKKGKEFPLAELCLIALQVLDRLQTLHCQYFIHRDIKPDNFLIGRKDPNIIYLIDFGLSKKYKSSQTRKHIKYRNTGKLTGTLRFGSPNALKGGEQSRKDDLISAGYMIIYFMRKKLPWQYIKGQNSTDKYIKIYKMKKEIKPDKLCSNLPKQMTEYMKYVQHLTFEQEPDYKYLKNLFKSILKSLNLNSDKLIFSWIKPSDIKNLKKPVNPKSRKSSSRERLYRKIAENLKEKQRGTSSESSDNRSYEMIPNTINKVDINNIKLQRNYSDENLDDISFKANNNNTLFVNFDKTINNKLINKFENIDKQLESKEQSNNQIGELSIKENQNNNDTSENNNEIFSFSRKINFELKNDKSKLQDNENDVSDVISRIKKEKENFYGKNNPNAKEIKNNDNENIIEKQKEKINDLIDNNIILKNKENNVESKNLINNNIIEMINKQNNNNNNNNIKNLNLENGGQNIFPKDENNLIKNDEQLQKTNIKNNLNNLSKVNNNITNKKNNNILNNNKINTVKNIQKNFNNKNINITKNNKNNNQLNQRIKPNLLINNNKINPNKNIRNYNNNINYINLTEPSDAILDDDIKMHKVQTEQNNRNNNIFKVFNEKNNDINKMDINFNLNKQLILNGKNKNINQINNKNIMLNNKNKVTTKKLVNKQINNNPSKITNMGEIKNKGQVKNINNNMININKIKNNGKILFPRRIIMNNTNYPNNNNYMNFNNIPNNNINYIPNNNIQNNNLEGQYSNYPNKYQQFNTLNTTGNNRQFRYKIQNKEFNDFY